MGSKEYGPSVFTPFHNIRVVCCSYGTYTPSALAKRHLNNLSPYMLFVASAGNDGLNTRTIFPASHANALAVAAYDDAGARSNWGGSFSSNYASDVDVAAPGSEIITIDMEGYSNGNPNGFDTGVLYGNFRGTSAAAPHAAAVAALVSGKYSSFSPAAVKFRICTYTSPLSGSLSFCDGLNAKSALGI